MWRCKEDLKLFKSLTLNTTCLVGWNTSIELPPLKNRTIIVDDRTSGLNDVNAIDWCIGGKKTYEKYAHLFTELHISHIDDDNIGDVTFPDLRNLNPDCKIFHYYFKAE
jgi:dihydrofolate reductase